MSTVRSIYAKTRSYNTNISSRNIDSIINKSAQSNVGTGPRRGGLSGPWTVQHCAVACIHEYASCPSGAAAAVIAPRVQEHFAACI